MYTGTPPGLIGRLLIGMGLEAYRKENSATIPEPEQEEAPEGGSMELARKGGYLNMEKDIADFVFKPIQDKIDDLKAFVRNIEIVTSYSWCEDLMERLVKGRKGEGVTLYDKTLLLIRWAYLSGYREGLYAENNKPVVRAEQVKRLDGLVVSKIRSKKGEKVIEILEKYPRVKRFDELPFNTCLDLEAELAAL
jgi:hypothetical protein